MNFRRQNLFIARNKNYFMLLSPRKNLQQFEAEHLPNDVHDNNIVKGCKNSQFNMQQFYAFNLQKLINHAMSKETLEFLLDLDYYTSYQSLLYILSNIITYFINIKLTF